MQRCSIECRSHQARKLEVRSPRQLYSSYAGDTDDPYGGLNPGWNCITQKGRQPWKIFGTLNTEHYVGDPDDYWEDSTPSFRVFNCADSPG